MKQEFNKDKAISIYGFGNHGKKFAEYCLSNKIRVDYFIDINAQNNQKIFNIPCIKPDLVTSDINQVVIAVFNRLSSPKNIGQFLFKKGVENIISYHQIPNYYPSALKNCFWHDPIFFSHNNQEKINELKGIFSEEKSLTLLNEIVKFRKTGDLHQHPNGDGITRQYFEVGIPNWLTHDEIVMVDCGAYDGDTIASAKNHSIPIKSAFCFEPDQQNFEQLKTNFQNDKSIQFSFYPLATWSENTTLSFQDAKGEGSFIAPEGKLIQAISIDQVFRELNFNFLKIDVEGADLETIVGSKNSLLRLRPDIAVSLYHKPKDLWEIPIYLKKLLPDYKFYLRQHGECCLETVLYCVPQ